MSLPFLNSLLNLCTATGLTSCLFLVLHPYGFETFEVIPLLIVLFPSLIWLLFFGNKALYRKPPAAKRRVKITAVFSVVSTAALVFVLLLVFALDGAWSTERHGRFSETELHVFTNPLIGWSGLLLVLCSWLTLIVNTAEQRTYTFAVVLHISLLIVFSVVCVAAQGAAKPVMNTSG